MTQDTKNDRESGFTLLELLVVLAIMGLLMAIVGPQVISGELRELVDFVRTGRVQPIAIECRGFDEADDALHRLHKGQQAGRAVLVPSALAP